MKWVWIAGSIVSAWISGVLTDENPKSIQAAIWFLLLAVLFGIAAGLWR